MRKNETLKIKIEKFLSEKQITNHHFSEAGEAAFLCRTKEGIHFTIEEPHASARYYKIFGILLQYYDDVDLARLYKEKIPGHPDFIKVNDICIQECGFIFYEMTIDEEQDELLVQRLGEFVDSFVEVLAITT